MKKSVVLVSLLLCIVQMLTSCKFVDKITASDPKYEKTQTAVTPGVEDYDPKGNIILVSTENRYVYVIEDGYMIFSINSTTDTVYQVLYCKPFETEEDLNKYIAENTPTPKDTKSYTSITKNGLFAIHKVALFNEKYGKLLAGSRNDVINAFPEETKIK